MEFAVTKELLNFLLRFRCSNCEFSTLEATPIQKHLRECLRKDKNEFVIEQEECKPQIEAVLCGETADEFVIELVEEEEDKLKAELDIKDDNVKTNEEDHHLQQPQIEAVLSGETAEILFEMEDDDLEFGQLGQPEQIPQLGQVSQFGQPGQIQQFGQPRQIQQLGQPGQIGQLSQIGQVGQNEPNGQVRPSIKSITGSLASKPMESINDEEEYFTYLSPNEAENLAVNTKTQEDMSIGFTRVNESVYPSYYNKITSSSSKCRYCPAIISTKGGSTSGLKKHLVSRHKKMYLEEVKPKVDARKNICPNRKNLTKHIAFLS
mgnify:CR=1 FL=1